MTRPQCSHRDIHSLSCRFLLLVCTALSLAGCGVVLIGGAAAGTVGYVSGDLNATLEDTFDRVVAATDLAIAENSITEVTRTPEQYQVLYVLKTLQDDKVQLTVARVTNDMTSVSIRIGLFGDEPLSRQILNEIESRLSK